MSTTIDTDIRGLSLTQPWATLMAEGKKQIETRSWYTLYKGSVAIHAAKTFPRWARDLAQTGTFLNALNRPNEEFPLGAIVAVGNLHRVGRIGQRSDGAVYIVGRDLPVEGDEVEFGDYSPGRYAWVFTNVQPLAHPVPCRGALGLWHVPAGVLEQVTIQL